MRMADECGAKRCWMARLIGPVDRDLDAAGRSGEVTAFVTQLHGR
jgi:hypothetical protein